MTGVKRRIRVNWFGLLVQCGLILAVLVLSGAFQNRKTFMFVMGMIVLWMVIGTLFRRFSLVAEQVIWPNTIRRLDDRGQPVVVGGVVLKDMGMSGTQQRLMALLPPSSQPWYTRPWGYLLIVVGVFVAWIVWVRNGTALVGHDVALYGGMTVFFLGVYFAGRMMRRRRLRDMARWLQILGHCPACGYNLHAIAPHTDGCKVCPECGAAWKPQVQAS